MNARTGFGTFQAVSAGRLKPSLNRTGVSISSGGAHGYAFLGMLKSFNDAGLLNNLAALGGASAGSVITSIIASIVNRRLLDGGDPKNMQAYIGEGIEAVYRLFHDGAKRYDNFNFTTRGVFQDPTFGPLFQSFARAWGQPDPLNHHNLSTLPPYLDPDAVKDGPVDTFIGLSKYGLAAKIGSHVVKNDVRTEIVAASCALHEAIRVDGVWYSDGGNTKAAPVSPLIEDAQCGVVIMIGETYLDVPVIARHQTQGLMAENNWHATPYFEGHARRLTKIYGGGIWYAGVPLPNDDNSRRNVGLESLQALYSHGQESGKIWLDRHGENFLNAKIASDKVPVPA